MEIKEKKYAIYHKMEVSFVPTQNGMVPRNFLRINNYHNLTLFLSKKSTYKRSKGLVL